MNESAFVDSNVWIYLLVQGQDDQKRSDARVLIEGKRFFVSTQVNIDQQTLLSASDLRTRYAISFWDSPIVAAALQSGAQILYTEDMQHGLVVDERLRIANPFHQE